MARKTSKFLVGLFVIIGVLIGMIAIIWVGATRYFQTGDTYVTYLDESVQGLQKDSTVRYRGVEVGRVEEIEVAPDNRLIAVVMKIDLEDNLTHNTVAQLSAAGITGIMYIDLDRRKPGDTDLSPQIDFPSEYPIIPSRPSEKEKILSGIEEIVNKLKQVDTKGISDQIIASTKEMENFLNGEQMQKILARVESAANNLDELSAQVKQVVARGRLDQVLVGVDKTLKSATAVLNNAEKQLTEMKLAETVKETRRIARDLEGTNRNLRRASENLEMLMERLSNRPSDLLFGKPPTPRWNE
ncbi:MAG: MlaD family protein [Desulfobacca sp.]|nr:MlaD family protein [Desulfobacca sp.]